MKIYFYRIGVIDQLIQAENTGNAYQLANTLGIARCTLFKYLNDMKELGAPHCLLQAKEHLLLPEQRFFYAAF
ncbi:hypothetical protein [Longitalea arenae]|uniref:hypothetical protein n=1 Tax=Longitalea arenae TaxID=2812558 RepID=UPI001967F5BD|nr:hypothetical protein [Longitalea arenae]